MPSTLNTETLKALRGQKNLTQDELARQCNCTLDTVGRWERGESKVSKQRFKDALCKALGVTWDQLCHPYQSGSETKAPRAADDEQEEIFRKRNLNARVSHHAHLAFALASQRYGARIADIVELAPLLFMIAAEQSLADRQKENNSRRKALCKAEKKLSRYSIAMVTESDVEEDLASEDASIKRREVFGHDHWRSHNWDLSVIDPFGSYLRRLVEATEPSLGFISIAHGCLEAPPYRLGIDALKAITGLTGDTEHEQTALYYIEKGFLDVRELLAKKKSLSLRDFQEWLPGWVSSYDESNLD